jgi:hypothetical protein
MKTWSSFLLTVRGAAYDRLSRAFFIAVIIGGGPVSSHTLVSWKYDPEYSVLLTAKEDLHSSGRVIRSRQAFFDHICIHEADSLCPAGRRVVQDVVHAETLRVLGF